MPDAVPRSRATEKLLVFLRKDQGSQTKQSRQCAFVREAMSKGKTRRLHTLVSRVVHGSATTFLSDGADPAAYLPRCPLPCHPANCDPCNAMLRLQCHCGKEDKTIKCGTLHPQTGVTSQVIDVNDYLSCRQACDKLLGCGLHRCEKECHSGDCGDCELIREKTCYCGQEQKEETCGTALQAEIRHTCFAEDDSEKSWTGEWSCRQPSTWKYDCGVHEEASTERKICHPHAGPSRLPCPRAPAVVSTCACGQTPLQALARPPRTKCTDAIPSCGKICNKKLKTCEHSCPAVCHEGQCQRCEEMVTLVCRCGNEKKTMECHQLQEEGEEELRCERICRALRACGRHECGRKVSCRLYTGQGGSRAILILCPHAVLPSRLSGGQQETKASAAPRGRRRSARPARMRPHLWTQAQLWSAHLLAARSSRALPAVPAIILR